LFRQHLRKNYETAMIVSDRHIKYQYICVSIGIK